LDYLTKGKRERERETSFQLITNLNCYYKLVVARNRWDINYLTVNFSRQLIFI